jgi:hypothetical protein
LTFSRINVHHLFSMGRGARKSGDPVCSLGEAWGRQ